MKKTLAMAGALMMAFAVLAQAKRDPVAEGFTDWSGVVDKNHFRGRMLCPSDLRHKFVFVVEIDPKDAASARKQLLAAVPFVRRNFFHSSHGATSWERLEMKREPQVVIANFGTKDEKVFADAMKTDNKAEVEALSTFRTGLIPFYHGLTYEGAPDTAGKRPFVYLMGATSAQPLASGPATRETLDKMSKAVTAARAKLKADGWFWLPFTGSIEEPQFFKSLKKTLTSKKPKPLTADMAKIKKGIASKKAEVAKEAQILFDALEQTRSDLVFRIQAEARECPHRAAYDIQQLLRFWPNEKKRISAYADRLKELPEAGALARIFVQMMEWSDSEFVPKNAAAAKKIVAEIEKMKKILEKLKESKVVVIQNGAAMLDAELDELISAIPSRVPEK